MQISLFKRAQSVSRRTPQHAIRPFSLHHRVGLNLSWHPQWASAHCGMRLNLRAEPFDSWRIGRTAPSGGQGVRYSPVRLTLSNWEDYMTSKRSSIITLFQAVTKSRRNFCCPSSAA